MEKVKIALTVLSVMLVLGPVLGVVFVYRDNLIGLVLPPEVNDMMNGQGSGNGSSIFSVASNFEAPSLASQPQYNSDTGAFVVSFNFTNPLSSPISVDQFSADIKSQDTNAFLGNITLNQPINIGPGENSLIDVVGSLDPATVNQLKAQYPGNDNLNLALENVNAVVGGITVHLDRLDLGSMQLPGE